MCVRPDDSPLCTGAVSFAGLMENPAALKEHRTLDDAELEAMTGGFFAGLTDDPLVKAKTARVSGVAVSEVLELNN